MASVIEFEDDEAAVERDAAEIEAMDDEEVRAWLIREGADPDEFYERLRAELLRDYGINLPPPKPRSCA